MISWKRHHFKTIAEHFLDCKTFNSHAYFDMHKYSTLLHTQICIYEGMLIFMHCELGIFANDLSGCQIFLTKSKQPALYSCYGISVFFIIH